MASTHKSLRSSTANKRPTTSIADGQIALNTNTTSPGLFFKDSTGATIIKVGPVHVGATAPNSTVPAGGSAGNSTGEIWLDTSLTPVGVKIWNGSSFVNATPIGSTTVQGLLELATDAETQTGVDTARAVTPASLQSKVSDSTGTTSSTTIASSTAVKSAYDLADAALPKSGGVVTGALEIGTTGSLVFEGSTADGNETTLAVVDPTADRTISLPNVSGTVITTGDSGTVTSAMIADNTIVNDDINSAAAIAHSKFASITAGQVLLGNASNVPTATALSGDVVVNSSGVTAISSDVIVNADINSSADIAHSKLASITAGQVLLGNVSNVPTATALSGDVTVSSSGVTAISSGVIVDADINAGAAIADTKLATITTASKVNGSALTGTIPSGVLGNSTVHIGTTAVVLNRASANQGLTGISSVALPGSTSGTVTVQPAAVAGTTTITLPATTGTVVTTGDSGTVTSTMIADGTIVNADVNASAAIAGTKVSPDFGSQNVITTGTVTGASLSPTSSAVPSNGVYLPAANSVAISTGGSGRLFVDASGNVGVGAAPSTAFHVTRSAADAAIRVDGGTSNTSFIDFRIAGSNKSYVGLGGLTGGSNNDLINYNSSAGNWIAYTNATERLRITSTGDLNFKGAGSAGSTQAVSFNGSAPVNSLVINSSGHLGVGTSSPSKQLSIRTSSADVGISLGAGANAFNQDIDFLNSVDSVSGRIRYYPDSGFMSFWTSSVERARIDSSGRLGIGATPSTVLDVNTSSGNSQLRISNGTFIGYFGIDSTFAGVDYASQSGGHRFRIGSSFTEAARIDSSGRLLVGTSSAQGVALLQVQGDSASTQNYSQLTLRRGLAASSYTVGGNFIGEINFQELNGGSFGSIRLETDAACGNNDFPGRLVFSTTPDGSSSPTERVRIRNDGTTSFGQAGVGPGSGTAGTLISYGDGGIFITNNTEPFLRCYTLNGGFPNALQIAANGNVTNANNSYGGISDIKLKENIVDANSQWDDIKAFQVRNYNFKEGQTHTQIGLVAQEVELVSPGLVTESPDRDAEGNDLGTVTKSVNYSVLYMKAVKALQEAMERIETLEANNADLLARVSALESA